eukprot:scaffold291713_cov18-Prasinocladus_malaysianus.AAC.1
MSQQCGWHIAQDRICCRINPTRPPEGPGASLVQKTSAIRKDSAIIEKLLAKHAKHFQHGALDQAR